MLWDRANLSVWQMLMLAAECSEPTWLEGDDWEVVAIAPAGAAVALAIRRQQIGGAPTAQRHETLVFKHRHLLCGLRLWHEDKEFDDVMQLQCLEQENDPVSCDTSRS